MTRKKKDDGRISRKELAALVREHGALDLVFRDKIRRIHRSGRIEYRYLDDDGGGFMRACHNHFNTSLTAAIDNMCGYIQMFSRDYHVAHAIIVVATRKRLRASDRPRAVKGGRK